MNKNHETDTRPRLLFIDDYQDLLSSLKTHFELDGYNVDTAVDGKSALSLCEKSPYDFALVDVMLPDGDGDELVMKMRKILPDIECVIMTGNATIESAIKSVGRPGVVAYEIKPIDLNNISLLIREVLARKKLERSLRESEARYGRLIEASPFGVCVIQDDRIVFVNREFSRISGCGSRNYETPAPAPWKYEDDYLRILKELHPSSESGEGGEYRVDIPGGNGEKISARVTVTSGEIHGVPDSIIAFIEDITEREKMRRQLLRSERNNLVAQLSMSLHHEIKNPLAIISGHAQTLRETPALENAEDEDIGYSLDVIGKQVERIVTVLNNLSMLARESKSPRKPVDALMLIERIKTMFSSRLNKASVHLSVDVEGGNTIISEADEGRLLQVFANIILNSIESMEDGGELKISVSGEDHLSFLKIGFHDTGCGIDSCDSAKLFEPFFTTKFEGTGMGLAVCRSIVEEHGGMIDIAARPGGGTSVIMQLPINRE